MVWLLHLSLLFATQFQAPELARQTEKATEVVVLGTIHGAHRESKSWSLDALRETIRKIQPEVVLCEIPPDRWPAVLKRWQEAAVVEDERVQRFPEYTEVLLPLMDEMGFLVEPCAAWTAEMAAERKAAIQRFEGGGGQPPEDSEALQAYRAAIRWTSEWAAQLSMDAEDPLVLHSRLYDFRSKGERLPYEHWLNDRIGEGGWRNINQAHYSLLETALAKHAGKRILITFGAGHKYWFLERLRWRPDLNLMDPRPFLPGGERPRSKEEAVLEEVYAFNEAVWRCFYDAGHEFLRPALARIGRSMNPRDEFGFVNGLRPSPRGSTFWDQQWLGPVIAEQEEEGVWEVRFSILRAMQSANEARKVSATLVQDSTMTGGFRWNKIQWPR
ncbi:MAG: hypothetical protein DWQ01_17425 [Planctomycetota bacterium]|nr:MAG: hypothetical protein DWQ01_17425 [Planctomycetota bacterium]